MIDDIEAQAKRDWDESRKNELHRAHGMEWEWLQEGGKLKEAFLAHATESATFGDMSTNEKIEMLFERTNRIIAFLRAMQ